MNNYNKIDVSDIEVLFDNKPLKKFIHEGKTFIIAKDDSEYELKIFNSNIGKVLCRAGIDGVGVIDGEQFTEKSPGYLIDGKNSFRLKGFRINDNEVANFKFVKKESSYATEKHGKDAQCGVITIQIYSEKQKEIQNWPNVIKEKEYIPYPVWPSHPYPNDWDYLWWVRPYRTNRPIWYSDYTLTCESTNTTNFNSDQNGLLCSTQANYAAADSNEYTVKSNNFDLGSTFGKIQENKVTEVPFEEGVLLGEINIYYASKESLIKMGVNITNESKINFPIGVKKYCSLPKNYE